MTLADVPTSATSIDFDLVSVDDHVVEPATLWTDRLPRRFQDAAPRVRRETVPMVSKPGESKEGDVWYFGEDRVEVTRGFAAVSYEDRSQLELEVMTYDEMRPGAFDVKQRLADMDLDGVEASVCFPNAFVRFCGQRFLSGPDKELGLACVRAYNDFLVEDWAGQSDGRLYGVGIIPLWDARLAAQEIYRISGRGITSVCFSEIPPRLGLPSLYSGDWDPFLAACEETSTVVNMHIGSSSEVHTSSADAPIGVRVANDFHNSAFSVTDWLLSGVFIRFPGLKAAFSEGQAGWLPFLLSRLDQLWAGKAPLIGFNHLPEAPSSYVPGHVYTCIFNDPAAMQLITQAYRGGVFQVTEDNTMFEVDYPHNDSVWPHSKQTAAELTAELTPAQREKVLRTNAARLYRVRRVLGTL
jgi:predicted TIM-barrel fold metal-dependent hydrolase